MTVAGLALLCLIPGFAAELPASGKLKVFVLAGQSNMQGHGIVDQSGKVGTMTDYLEKRPEAYSHLVGADGKPRVRDDVWVANVTRSEKPKGMKPKDSGWLTTGFGIGDNAIGPEYGFGWVLGDYYEDPVLLIKCSWGGKALATNFLPPSADDYPEPKEPGDLGFHYAETVRITKEVLSNLKAHFPAYDGQGYELVGFGWHQGWNDRTKDDRVEAYASNMAHFIEDIREDLGAEDLPFVIANTGMGGKKVKKSRPLKLMEDQLSLADPGKYPDFAGNVAAVDTRPFQRPREDSPSMQGYHWFKNWETYYLIGEGMGKAMVELLDDRG